MLRCLKTVAKLKIASAAKASVTLKMLDLSLPVAAGQTDRISLGQGRVVYV